MSDEKPKKRKKKTEGNSLEGAVPFDIKAFDKFGGYEPEDEDEDTHEHEHNPDGSCIQEEVVVSTIPIKREWKAIMDEMKAEMKSTKKLAREAKKKMYTMSMLQRKLWARIESDTGIIGEMRINHDTQEVEVMK